MNALGEPGIVFNREPERLYPQTAMAGHVLGWTDMRGPRRRRHGARARRSGCPIRRGAASRSPCRSTAGCRRALESELAGAVASMSAEGGTGIVLDVRTGEVVAMASAPTFNPNAAGRSDAKRALQPRDDGRLRAGLGLQADHHRGGDGGRRGHLASARCGTPPRRCTVGRFRINDDHPLGRRISVAELMVHSSNIAHRADRRPDGRGADAGRLPHRRLRPAHAHRAATSAPSRSGRATGAGRRC